jgi:hypothetical protein
VRSLRVFVERPNPRQDVLARRRVPVFGLDVSQDLISKYLGIVT